MEVFNNLHFGASPPLGLQHGPERKVRLELISVLDFFGSFLIKQKGTKKISIFAKQNIFCYG